MKHTQIALRRPVTTVMVFVALSLIGLVSARLLPLEQFPDIEFPGIFIQVPYPNSTPEEIERTITRPIEESLATLSGIEQMRSTSTRYAISCPTTSSASLFLPAHSATSLSSICASRASGTCLTPTTCWTAISNAE